MRRNRIAGNVTGTRIVGEGSIRSENNLFVDNASTAWLVEGEALVESTNDTVAGHGDAAFALRAEPGACQRRPRLRLVNGIIWSTPAAFVGANDGVCDGWPAYQIGVSYTLLVTPAAYAADPDVALGAGVGGDAPGFVGDGTRRLATGAAAVDAGWNGAGVNEDFAGARRPEDGNLDGVAVSDVGAYEYVPLRLFLPIVISP